MSYPPYGWVSSSCPGWRPLPTRTCNYLQKGRKGRPHPEPLRAFRPTRHPAYSFTGQSTRPLGRFFIHPNNLNKDSPQKRYQRARGCLILVGECLLGHVCGEYSITGLPVVLRYGVELVPAGTRILGVFLLLEYHTHSCCLVLYIAIYKKLSS